MHTLIPILFLTFTYLALSENLQADNIIFGIFIAVGILVLIRPTRRPVKWKRLPTALLSSIVYIVVLLYNMFRSGIQITRIILDPKLPIQSGIVGIRAASKSELGRALSAHAISLPPGELFVEYQLAAKKMRNDLFVTMAAYGDGGPGYIPTAIAFKQGGYEASDTTGSRLLPEVESATAGDF